MMPNRRPKRSKMVPGLVAAIAPTPTPTTTATMVLKKVSSTVAGKYC